MKIIRIDQSASLNVIISSIKELDVDRIILRFEEGNDVIGSIVGLKTLKKKVLELGKVVAISVPSEGYRKLVEDTGFVIIDEANMENISVWQGIVEELNNYKKDKDVKSNVRRNDGNKEIVRQRDSSNFISKINTFSSKDSFKENQFNEDKKEDRSLVGQDFSRISVSKKSIFKTADIFSRRSSNMNTFTGRPKIDFKDSIDRLSIKPNDSKFGIKGIKLLMIQIFVGMFVFMAGIIFLYYKYVPSVRVQVYMDSKSFNINETVFAVLSVTGFDANTKEIQMINELVKKEGSANITATGEAYSGTKASGIVRIVNKNANPISIPVGTVFSSNGLKFTSDSEVAINGSLGSGDVSVSATNFGEEYNIASGSSFIIEKSEMGVYEATNPSAFSGGTKIKKTVVSKKDKDMGVKNLKSTLIKTTEAELAELNKDNGYVLIKESVKSDLDGDPKLNPDVGVETSEAYLEVSVKSEGIYYHKDSLDRLAENLLIKKYKTDNAIDETMDLMVKNLRVSIGKMKIESDRKKVSIDIAVEGLITLKVDEQLIQKTIKGKKWEDGYQALKEIKGFSKNPILKFVPDFMPRFLYYIPKEETRIDVSVELE